MTRPRCDSAVHHPFATRFLRTVLVVLVCVCPVETAEVWAEDQPEIGRLIAQAEAMLRFGLEEKGSIRDFAGGIEFLDRASEVLASSDTSDADRARWAYQIQVLREDLTFNLERSSQRFYGVFPMARFMVPFPLMSPPEDLIETLHPKPANEAVGMAAERLVAGIVRFRHPQVVFRSVPPNRGFENEAMRVLNDANGPHALSRADLVAALTTEDLAAFDRGDLQSGVIGRMMQALGATDLLVVTVTEGTPLPDGDMVVLDGAFFKTGLDEPIDTSVHLGFARGRGHQLRWMVAAHLILFSVALVLAARTRWSVTAPWSMTGRIFMGAALFTIGRVAAPLAIIAMNQVMPQPDSAVSASWWWPAAVGLVFIVGTGLVAWVAQARVTRIVPGTRGSHAVGMIFALAALGACAYVSEPLLLLLPRGAAVVYLPFVLSAFMLAALFGYAIRTGPPVPTYFAGGPTVVAPAAGLALYAVSAVLLWAVVLTSALICAVAVARHRYAVARDIEEAELDEPDAQKADMERLAKIEKNVKKTLPM